MENKLYETFNFVKAFFLLIIFSGAIIVNAQSASVRDKLFSLEKHSTEVVSKRNRVSKTLKLSNGQYAVRIFKEAVHYLDEFNNWRDIDNTVRTSSVPRYAFENSTNGVKSYFPRVLSNKTGVKVAFDAGSYTMGGTFSFTMGNDIKNENEKGGIKIDFSKTSARKASANKVIYDTEHELGYLEYEVNSDELKQQFILKELPPAARTNSMKYLFMSESFFVQRLNRGNQYMLRMSIPLDWLTAPEREFPIVIDPSSIIPGNFGGWMNTSPNFLDGNPTSFVFTGLNTNGFSYRGYNMFDISSISDQAVINSVILELECNGVGDGSATVNMEVNDVAPENYGPYGAYNSAIYSDFGDGTYTTLQVTGTGTYSSIDLGAQAAADLQSQLNSNQFEIALDNENGTGSWKRFTSNLNNITVYYSFPPEISSVNLAADNSYVDVTFTSGVYNTNAAAGAIEASDFNLNLFGGSATNPTVSSVTTTGGAALSGGENVIRINFSVTGTPNGGETLTVNPISNSVFGGDGNAASTSQSNNSATLNDQTAPTISSIVRQSPLSSPTNTDQLVWDVTFSEPVLNVDASDFSLSGTTATVTNTADQSGNVYRVTVSGGDLAGLNSTVTLSFSGGQNITDAAGNALTNTTPTGINNDTFVVDNTAPTITISIISSDDIINSTEDDSDVTINGTSSGAEDGQTITVGLNGKTYTGTVNSNTWSVTVPAADVQVLSVSETVTADVSDLVGNTAAQTTRNLTRDTDIPTLSIGSPSTALTNNGPVSYSITYVGATNINLTAGDVTLNTTGSTNGNVSVSNGTTSNSTVTISGISGDGTLGITIAGGTSSDAAGNTDAGAGPSATFTVDNTIPSGYSVSIDQPVINSANYSAVSFTLNGAIVGTTYDYTFSSSGGGTIVTGSGTIISSNQQVNGINLNGLNDGTITLSITLEDDLGNTGVAATDAKLKDTANPTVLISSTVLKLTINFPFILTIDFSESVNGFELGDISVINGSAENFIAESTTKYKAEITPESDGVVSVVVPAGVAHDGAGNGNTGSSEFTINYDNTAPANYTASIDQPAINFGNQHSVSFTIDSAEIASVYKYTFSNGSGPTVSDSGTVSSANQQITNIDLSGIQDGTITLSVTLTDSTGNTGNASTDTKLKDVVQPMVSITSTESNPKNNTPFLVTIEFNEEVEGFTEEDIEVSNATKSNFISVSLKQYIVEITALASGTVTVDVPVSSAQDAAGNNNSAAGQLSLVSSNNAPILSSIEAMPLIYSENEPTLQISRTIEVIDIDDVNIDSAIVQITGNYQYDEDVLSYTNQNGITGNWDSLTGTMTLSGSSTKENYQTALRDVRYFDKSNNPSTLTRTISFFVNDGDNTSIEAARTINIQEVNDPPLVSFQFRPITFNEDESITVSFKEIYPSISDPDNVVS